MLPEYCMKSARLSAAEQLKHLAAYHLSHQMLCLDMAKPFNPILGETFQCYFSGTPMYFEQVSHHPPILSFYVAGTEFTSHGSVEPKLKLSLNSGEGYFSGRYIVNFHRNGNRVELRGNGGIVEGLVYGARRFSFTGRLMLISHTFNLVLVCRYNPDQAGFFSFKKGPTARDYFRGGIYKVTPEYIDLCTR
jgi:hypothetical protein